MRPRKLSDQDILDVKAAYRKANGARGIVARLARQYGVSRQAILRALDSYATGPDSPGTGSGSVPGPNAVSDAFRCAECAAPNLLPNQSDHTQWCSERGAA